MRRGLARASRSILFASCVALTVFVPGLLAAQESASAETVAYDAAWYQKFSPRTALDMISRTPGFTADLRGASRRGLSDTTGNVLIDGQRPSAKSQGLAEILQRIPAKQVTRIELLRGAAIAGDPSGATVLANVVRTDSGGGGAWSASLQHSPGHGVDPSGFASWSGRRGALDYAIGANTRSSDVDLPGERHVYDAAGNLSAVRIDASPRQFAAQSLNTEMARAIPEGRVALTGQVAYSRYREQSTLTTLSTDGVRLEDESNPYDGSTHAFEGGLSVDRSLGAWEVALTALLNRNRAAIDTSSIHRNGDSVVDSAILQSLGRDRGEQIAHLDLSRDVAGHRFEAGLEGALNTLDARTSQWQDTGSGWAPVYLPNANLQVREQRQETFAGYAWKPRGAWSMEAKLAAESSRLDLTGDAERSVELVYWKPSLQIGHTVGGRSQLRLRLFRDVGQLDFNDFVSAPSLADDVVNGGNPALRPETSWRAEVAADLRFGDDSALNIRGYHYRLSDTVDLVSVGDPALGAVAPANIGEGSITGIDLSCNLPLLAILPGATFGFAATVQESDVIDPVTRDPRATSGFQPSRFRAELRQDVVDLRFAWGINYAQGAATRRFSPTEIDERRSGPSLDLFFETTALDAFKLRLSALSVLGSSDERDRSFYAPDRGGEFTSMESSERRPGNRWLLTLSGNL